MLVALLASCDHGDQHDSPPDASPSASAAVSPGEARIRAVRAAELRRRATDITHEDLTSRDVRLRRAAVRALARIRGPRAREGLERALSDEDQLVVAWAAYGLGDDCEGHRAATVSALVAAGAAWRHRRGGASAEDDRIGTAQWRRGNAMELHAVVDAIARAVGRCAAVPTSENTLRTWVRLGGPRAESAIQALGDVATQRRKLAEDTLVQLLNTAAGNAIDPPNPWALYPIGRLEHVPPSVQQRALGVAQAVLDTEPSPQRLFAIRVLARCGDDARSRLESVIIAPDRYTAAERSEAARSMSRFGRNGQSALQRALTALVPPNKPLSHEQLMSAEMGVLLTLLDTLSRAGDARRSLLWLAQRKAPEDSSPALVRRLSWLRCKSAQLLAGRKFNEPLLRSCDLATVDKDPLPTSIGGRAIVSAIGFDGSKITGARAVHWRRYALRGEIRARQQAIELIGSHPEIRKVQEVFVAALTAAEAGLVATAATVIAKRPNRALTDGKLDPKLRDALVAALDTTGDRVDLEAVGAAADAVGALSLDAARDPLRALCASPYASVRTHAAKALSAVLGGQKVVCSAPAEGLPSPVELGHLRRGKVTLTFASDVGELTMNLDADVAPLAVTRVADLATEGFYDGMVVHRVVPGFVTQLGSPTADGFGVPPGRPSIACETSPARSYAPWSVGVALAGRDTGTSQLFVTHAPVPHLDGRYAWLGSATGPWDEFVDGDRIISVKAPPLRAAP